MPGRTGEPIPQYRKTEKSTARHACIGHTTPRPMRLDPSTVGMSASPPMGLTTYICNGYLHQGSPVRTLVPDHRTLSPKAGLVSACNPHPSVGPSRGARGPRATREADPELRYSLSASGTGAWCGADVVAVCSVRDAADRI
jgi:hypothetical protein